MFWSAVEPSSITGKRHSTTLWREPLEKGLLCMHDLSHAGSLIEIADIDLTALREMSDKRFFTSRVVGFHPQQAIEKLLKCWLAILRI